MAVNKSTRDFFIVLIVGILLIVLGSQVGGWLRTFVAGQKVNELGVVDNYVLNHTLNPYENFISTEVELRWHDSKVDTFFFLLNRNLMISDINVTGGYSGELIVKSEQNDISQYFEDRFKREISLSETEDLTLYALPVSSDSKMTGIHLSYEGVIYDTVSVPGFSRWEIADETNGIIDPKGVFLAPTSGYYPIQPDKNHLANFTTTINYPRGWEAIVEGNIENEKNGSITYKSVLPLDGSYLVAGPYQKHSIQYNDIELAMYIYDGSEDLVDRYLLATENYFKMYEEMLGPYAFERFSVIENWFPTGYGMPSYTLLGSQVLRLPFIIHTSLGHEICHNWWGNGVLVDYDGGNWCEGLTVYCADYLYKVNQGEKAAKQYRLDVLRDYSDYIVNGDEIDFALKEFNSRTSAGTRTIGYGKSMMVFHMLEQRLGSDIFWQTLKTVYQEKQFTRASWNDFITAFEETSGERLDWYLKQWINLGGAPDLRVLHPSIVPTPDGDKFILEFDLQQIQEKFKFQLDVPIKVYFSDGSHLEKTLRNVHGKTYHARIEIDQRPIKFDVDPDFHLFRILDPSEAPATLSAFYGTDNPVVVIHSNSSRMRTEYRSFANAFFRNKEVEIFSETEFDQTRYKGRSILHM